MEYFVQIFVLKKNRLTSQGSVLSGTNLEAAVNEWLDERGLPRLYKWKFGAQVGSNTPRHGGVLNGLQFDSPKDKDAVLSLSVFALKPVDPVAERLV